MTEVTIPTTVEVSVRGRWVQVDAVRVGGDYIVLRGGWLKVASVFDEELKENEIDDPLNYIQAIRDTVSRGLKADIFTFTQKPANPVRRFAFKAENESIAAIRLEGFKSWWDKVPQTTRKNVRRSEKRGVTIQVVPFGEDLIRGIISVNNESALRQGRKSWHCGKSPEQVYKDYCSYSERSDFVCAYIGEEMIGFSQVIYRGDVAVLMQLTPKQGCEDARPANAMLAKVVELCAARGISYITYGKFNYGNKGKTKLREFKERNGFEEILVPRYYVPLSIFGSLCLAIGVHKGVIGILPGPALKIVFNLRQLWYKVIRRPV